MDNPFPTNDEVSGPKQGDSASHDDPPPSLRGMASEALAEQERIRRPATSLGSQFAESFSYEFNRNAQGIAQIVGAEKFVPDIAQPVESEDSLGQHAQMAGRAVAGLLPTLAMAATSRFGLGKFLGHDGTGAESAWLRRSAIGLNTAESAGTGFLVGSLLTPSDATARENWSSLIGDRISSGLTSAAAFSVMSASSLGLNRFATSEFASQIKIGGLLKNTGLNGVISGIPGGIANVEFDSIARTGQLSDDRTLLGKSVYEMSLFGGTFGLGARIMERSESVGTFASRMERLRDAPSSESTATPKNINYLGSIFGAESPAMTKLIAHDAAQSYSSPLNDIADFVRQNPTKRISLVEKELEKIDANYPKSANLGVHRLGALEKLQQQFGADSPQLEHVLKLEDGVSLNLPELAAFVEVDPVSRTNLVNRTIQSGGTVKDLSPYNLEATERLERHLGIDSPVVAQLKKLNNDSAVFSLHELSMFVDKDPGTRAPMIAEMVMNGEPAPKFYRTRLEAFVELRDKFGIDSTVMKNLLKSENAAQDGGSYMFKNVAKFIKENPERGPAILEHSTAEGSTIKDLSFERLMTRLALNDVFKGDKTLIQNWLNGDGVYERKFAAVSSFIQENPPVNSEVVRRVNGDGAYDSKLAGIVSFIQENPAVHSEVFKRVAANHPDDLAKIDEQYLKAFVEVSEHLGKDSDSLNYLASIDANMHSVAKYLRRNPGTGAATVEAAVKFGADSRLFQTSNLEGLRDILRISEQNSAFKARLPGLVEGGFNAYKLASYLEGDHDARDRAFRVVRAIDAGATGLQLQYLPALDSMSWHISLNDGDLKTLLEANRKGLDINILSERLVRSPEEVAPVLKEILGTEKTISDQPAPNPFVDLIRKMKAHEPSDEANYKFVNRVLDSVLNPVDATELNKFISEDPRNRVPLVRESVEGGQLNLPSLRGAENLTRQFGSGSKAMTQIYEGQKYYGLSLSELSDFVNADPRNKALVEQSLKNDDYISVPRLAGLQRLADTFGEHSDTTKYFLNLELEHGYSIGDLGKFLGEHPDQSAQLQDMVRTGVPESQLEPGRLSAKATLEKTFGKDSATLASMLQNESAVALSELTDFLNAKSNFAFAGDVAARKDLLDRVLGGGNHNFLPGDLETLFQLEHALGEKAFTGDKAEAQRLHSIEPHELTAIGRFLTSDPERALSFIRKVAEQADESSFAWALNSSSTRLSNVMKLDNLISLDKPLLQKIIDLDRQGVNVYELVGVIDSNEPKMRLAREAIEDGDARHLKPQRLTSVASLEQIFGRDSAAMKAILKHEDVLDIYSLAQLAEADRFRPLILDATENGGDPMRLNPARISALRHLKDNFQDRPDVMEKLLQLESEASKNKIESGAQNDSTTLKEFALSGISYFMDTPERKSIIEKLVDENAPLKDFEINNLILRSWFNEEKSDPQLASRILEFARDHDTAYGTFAYLHNNMFKYPDGLPSRESKVSAVVRMIELQAPRQVFDQMEAFMIFDRALGADEQLTKRVFQLHEQGMKLNDVIEFALRDESSTNTVKHLLASRAPVEMFSAKSLNSRKELQELAAPFAGDDQQAIVHLFEKGISPSRLKNFIDEHPEDRMSLVRTMIRENADVQRFNQQMSLTVLPDNVATAVVNASANGGMTVAQILGHLRDWRSGRHFRQALIDQVQAGKSLSMQDAEDLASQAKQRGIQDSGNLWPKLPATTTQGSLPQVLSDSVDGILGSVPKDKPVVVLGRDMWAVLPKLRIARPDAQYFLWSSTQDRVSAAKQWLKEVPPGASVIDTGYRGSIIDVISGVDPTISGYLLSTSGSKYSRLLNHQYHSSMVEKIEGMPKLIGKSTRYTDEGGTIARSSNREGNDVQKLRTRTTQTDRWIYERTARQTFRSMGLPEWDSWRYSLFTGVTPGERLGLSSEDDIQAHYRRVQHERTPKIVDPKPVQAK